jgi:hypothetical protein
VSFVFLLVFILFNSPTNLQAIAFASKEGAVSSKQTKTIVLPAEVIPSSEGYAQIHVNQMARLIVDSHHLIPKTGEKVKEGQVIAIVETLIPKADDTSKRTDLHKIEANIEKTNHEIKRLETLGGFSKRKELENKQIDLQKLHKQREVLLNFLGKEFLRSPIAGILNFPQHIFLGQVFKPEEPLAEIIKPGHVWIIAFMETPLSYKKLSEVYGYIPSQSQKRYPLKLIGVAPKLNKEQKQELLFTLVSPDPKLLIGTRLEVNIAYEEDN